MKNYVKSVIETYSLLFMFLTCRSLLKHTPCFEAYYKKGEKLRKHEKFRRGLITISALNGWKINPSSLLVLVSIPVNLANGLNLIELIEHPRLNGFCEFDLNDDFFQIKAIGTRGITRLWEVSTQHIRKKFPEFQLDSGFDTELLANPKKFNT